MSQLQTFVSERDADEQHLRNTHAMTMRAAVSLEHMPDGIEFPGGFRDRISYDPTRRLLVFRGFMSSADYYFLRTCSCDPAYIRAINDLHGKSSFDLQYRSRIVPLWLWTLVAAAFAMAGLVWLGWLMGTE